MKIASTTLIGPGTLELLHDCLTSLAPIVDLCILIPTTPEITDADVQREARLARVQHRLARTTWTDFGAGRNFSLDVATAAGVDWQLMIDTDERLVVVDGKSLRDELEANAAGMIGMMQNEARTYSRERLFRLPAKHRWTGRTHEYFSPEDRWDLDSVVMADIPKSQDLFRTKLERDFELLSLDAAEWPNFGRWHYYLGQTLNGLGRRREAIGEYLKCAELPGWKEERAWACYCAAELHAREGNFRQAIDVCSMGLVRHAGFCELPWLAGWCAFQIREYEQALCWAAMAAATGTWSGVGRAVKRFGFRHPPALFEGPHDIMMHAFRALGDERMAAVHASKVEHAMNFRLGKVPAPPPKGEEDPPA